MHIKDVSENLLFNNEFDFERDVSVYKTALALEETADGRTSIFLFENDLSFHIVSYSRDMVVCKEFQSPYIEGRVDDICMLFIDLTANIENIKDCADYKEDLYKNVVNAIFSYIKMDISKSTFTNSIDLIEHKNISSLIMSYIDTIDKCVFANNEFYVYGTD